MFSQAAAAEAVKGLTLTVSERGWKMGTEPGLTGFSGQLKAVVGSQGTMQLYFGQDI